MKNKIIDYLKSREKIRLKKLLNLNNILSLSDYSNTKSIFSDDILYFSSFELFMTKKDRLLQARVFIDEWIIFLAVDKTIKKWLINNNSLNNISILVPYCGSGIVTQIVIECLFVYFKKLYPLENNVILLQKIIKNHVHSWDIDSQCLDITKNRIQSIFNVDPVIKQTTTVLENGQFDIVIGHVPFGDLLSDNLKKSANSSYHDISLDFIDWSLKHLKKYGEVCYFVNNYLFTDKTYSYWRQQQYVNLTLHTMINVSKEQKKDNPFELLVLGLNNEPNYSITHYCLNNFTLKENIPVELFYSPHNHYFINF